MRAFRLPSFLVVLSVLVLAPRLAAAEESANASVVVSAQFSTRTALKVSSELLRFEVRPGSVATTEVVEFSAGARTYAGGEVVLTVEAAGELAAPAGASSAENMLTFSAEGGASGELRQSAPERLDQFFGGQCRDVLPVHPLELGRIEHGRLGLDPLEGEAPDHLVFREDLPVFAR